MKNVVLFLILFCVCNMVSAQRKITGIVTDAETSEALPGVNVVLKGTSRGVVSDLEGRYSLQVVSPDDILVFSFIGYQSQEIRVGLRSAVNVSLSSEVKGLEEVVVVGYGTMKKSDLTGSVVSVTDNQIKGSIVANLDQALQGRAAGVTAVQTSGQPGSSVSIRIRGQGTLRADASEPLYVVDGIPIQNISQSGHDVGLGDALGNGSVSTFSGLSLINPADILSVEILKDASATAIYGSRGANGVVLITTRRGKPGEARFTYEGYYGVQKQVKRMKVMNLREYAEYNNDWAAETNGRDPREELQDPSILGEGTDWQEAVFQISPMQSHQVSATGGTDQVKYFASGSYFTQDGTVVGSDFERYSTRVNIDAQLKKWFKLGANIMFTRTQENIGLNNSTDGIISVALMSSPDIPVYNTDGSWSGDQREGSPGRVNPIAKALDEENLLKRTSLVGNVYSDITFIPGLTLRTELGMDLGYSNAYHFVPTYQYGTVVNSTNSASRQYNQNFFWQLKNYLTYSRQMKSHTITIMAGQEVSESTWENLRGASTGLSSNDIHEPSLGDPKTMTIGSGKGSSAMASFFSRANYSWKERYMATYTFRYDGSSNFGPENRWAPFHSFAVSWRVNNEPLWEKLGLTIVNNFKIRAGWGQTGNANIGGYRWGASINKMPTGLGQGFRQSNIANPYITWEKQEQYNLGFDIGLLNNRISMIVDLYDKTSTAMLMDMQLPSYMGTRGNESIRLYPPMGNFGEIQNKGIEVSLNAMPIDRQFKWQTELSMTHNKNRLLDLDGTPSAHIEGYGQWTDLVSLTEIGQSLYNFYGYKVAGVYRNKQDIEESPKTKAYPSDGNFNRANTVWPGDLKFQDLSGPQGKPDGLIDEYDRTSLGSPLPKVTFGFSNTFSYKNFELNIFVNGSIGNKILNYMGRSLITMESLWDNQLQGAVNRAKLEPVDDSKSYPVDYFGRSLSDWFEDIDNVRVKNPDTGTPRAISGDPNDNNRISDRFIEDGSYLRFKNITFAWYVPQSLLRNTGIDQVKIYTNLQNMWTITSYSGFDPEVGASQTNDNVSGLDNGRYPSPRIYTFGMNITF